MKSIYDFSVRAISGKSTSMEDFRNKVLLVVNVASECGFTPQYEGLEALHRKYKDQGFAVLGFPCNQFGAQEPGTDKEIASFCSSRFGVTFPMFSKIEVNGPNTDPMWKYLKSAAPGVLGSEGIKWNFTKFLIDREGRVLRRFAPTDTPTQIESEIIPLLPH